ncbi:hypothetical protein CK501_02070 [Halovibrio salipaludis]|uniref:Uncharacterized protein n=1 Tax=Halovibrio salipaludis TaxID=2032626 RepID=A0A2A2FAI9_9GAMM|nr:nitrate/nitrite transporter NrtS [Halovibrio salipaludis]PAU81958.1 hypothetical protein CK501_02070 [Halovibrio salipaludis]
MNYRPSGISRLPHQCRRALVLAVSDGTPWRALKLAAVIGTLLVFINQWEALVGEAELSLAKTVLTFLIPYLVSTYTSVSKDLQRPEREAVHKSQSHVRT